MLDRYFIIVKGSGGGGLGDRLKSVLLALAYACKHNRVICVDWADHKMIDSDENVFDFLFSFKNIDVLAQEDMAHQINSEKVFPQSWQNKLHSSLHELYTDVNPSGWDRAMAKRRFSFDVCNSQSKTILDSEILVIWDFDQAHDYALKLGMSNSMDLYQYYAKNHLVFDNNINASVAKLFEKIRYEDNESNTNKNSIDIPIIGVHIRMTNEFSQQKNTLSLNDYIQKIDQLLLSLPNAKIFLATDNMNIQNKMKARYGCIVFFKDKWFSQPGDKLHFNDSCPDKLQSLIDAVTEMAMLSQCDALVYQYNSSFGECAHIFSKAESSFIIPLIPKISLYNKVANKIKDKLFT